MEHFWSAAESAAELVTTQLQASTPVYIMQSEQPCYTTPEDAGIATATRRSKSRRGDIRAKKRGAGGSSSSSARLRSGKAGSSSGSGSGRLNNTKSNSSSSSARNLKQHNRRSGKNLEETPIRDYVASDGNPKLRVYPHYTSFYKILERRAVEWDPNSATLYADAKESGSLVEAFVAGSGIVVVATDRVPEYHFDVDPSTQVAPASGYLTGHLNNISALLRNDVKGYLVDNTLFHYVPPAIPAPQYTVDTRIPGARAIAKLLNVASGKEGLATLGKGTNDNAKLMVIKAFELMLQQIGKTTEDPLPKDTATQSLAVIGDDLELDMDMAQAFALKRVLVLSGKTTEQEGQAWVAAGNTLTCYVNSIMELDTILHPSSDPVKK